MINKSSNKGFCSWIIYANYRPRLPESCFPQIPNNLKYYEYIPT